VFAGFRFPARSDHCGLTRLLASVLGPQIRVNAVAPGLVDTPWISGLQRVRARVREHITAGAPGASFSRYASQPAASSTRGPKAHNREVLILLLGKHPGIFTTLAPV
jgi:NAD(P)-dependent dehydrogenase (short-subunit alcohol dehydrogenase family)